MKINNVGTKEYKRIPKDYMKNPNCPVCKGKLERDIVDEYEEYYAVYLCRNCMTLGKKHLWFDNFEGILF